MKILALEFSSSYRSIALREGAMTISRVHTEGTITPVFKLIQSALTEAKWQIKEIEVVAVGLGPGSYTGVRLAIATAQGIILASGAKCAGVPSYFALSDEIPQGSGYVAIDAQQKEFYLAEFQNQKWSPLRIVPHSEVTMLIESGAYVGGPEIGHPLFPSAAGIALRALDFLTMAEELQPIYLRQTKFVKAAAPRIF